MLKSRTLETDSKFKDEFQGKFPKFMKDVLKQNGKELLISKSKIFDNQENVYNIEIDIAKPITDIL